ncbi:hypothetical protein MMA231_03451 (plasmid) [Asticcacaulis sp. MM231]|uniref:capsular polysaccharide export protein, LipB/KpsS family n=1 Tax=Asticcacaulis sp. MM231 TaxID=3157666 RepID=UPI0032D56886
MANMVFKHMWHIKSEKLFTSPLTILTACDRLYLKYLPALLRSLDLFSPGYDFVLHVINPQKGDLDFCQRLAESVASTSVSISYEVNLDLQDMSLPSQRAYFASARFIIASQLMRDSACPVLCLDADLVFINPIDMNFCRPDSDVGLVRRDEEVNGRPEHLKVAAGVVIFFPTIAARLFAEALATRLRENFSSGEPVWFVDQLALYQLMLELNGQVRIGSIKSKYADFQLYKLNSIIWSAKGDSKEFLEPFASLQKILGTSALEKVAAKHVLNRAALHSPDGKVNLFYEGRPQLRASLPKSGTLFLPRLDLPLQSHEPDLAPAIDGGDLADKLKMKEFAVYMVNCFERRGIRMEISELPNWQITAEYLNGKSGDFAVVAQGTDTQLAGLAIPVINCHHDYLPWLVRLDSEGINLPSYPVSIAVDYHGKYKTFVRSQKKLGIGEFTKLAATEGTSASETYDIGFLLQDDTSKNVRTHSHIDQVDAIAAVAAFARKKGLRVLLINPRSNIGPFIDNLSDETVFVTSAPMQKVLPNCKLLVTVNSGAVFEAMLYNKPIFTFGAASYDCVTCHVSPETLDVMWERCISDAGADGVTYEGFFNWYCENRVVDLSHNKSRQASLDKYVSEFIRHVYDEH